MRHKRLKKVTVLTVPIIILINMVTIMAACKSTELPDKEYKMTELNKMGCWKDMGKHNPLMTQKYGADPWTMIYNDTAYVYMTADEIEKDNNGEIIENSYTQIHRINVISSKDLVNWTDCGSVDIRASDVKWARNTWAPAAAHKVIDGKEKFFLYFADSANGIGVLTADSPVGPFTDPLGHGLITRKTPTCENITWLFDPAVLIDDDGTGYLYFGGGVPGGDKPTFEQIERPGNARVVKLNDDMISLADTPVVLDVPFLFEDSGINKFNGKYYYSYCTNWSMGEGQIVTKGQIAYMTSDSPLGPFTFQGVVLRNPGEFFGDWGNNHHCMFTLKNKNYMSYHTRILEATQFIKHGYRSTSIDYVTVEADGKLADIICTKKGVEQVGLLNPFEKTSAATMETMSSIETQPCEKLSIYYHSGAMSVKAKKAGAWMFLEGVDFSADGKNGANAVKASIRCAEKNNSSIEIYLDSTDTDNPGEKIGAIDLSKVNAGEEFQEVCAKLDKSISGKHNLLFVFTDTGAEWKDWQFTE